MTAAVLNIKISEVENKIPNATDWVKKIDFDAKIKDIKHLMQKHNQKNSPTNVIFLISLKILI